MKLDIVENIRTGNMTFNCSKDSIIKNVSVLEFKNTLQIFIETENAIMFYLKNPRLFIKTLRKPKKSFSDKVLSKVEKQIKKEYINN